MKVEVLYTEDCPNARPVMQRLKELAHDRRELTLELTLVVPDQPAPSRFAGSPTVLIDGHNPFRGAASDHASCALFPPTADEVQTELDRA